MKFHTKYIGVVLALALCSIRLSACDCDMKPVPVAYSEAQTVVLGTVIRIEEKSTVLLSEMRDSIQNMRQQLFFSDTIQYIVYTFRIDRKYKADYEQDTIQIIVGPSRSNCDMVFEMERSYILYAGDIAWKRMIFPEEKHTPYYFTSICMRTTENVELEMKQLNSNGFGN